MKNWKHWTFVAVIAIFGIIIGLIACDGSNGNSDPTYESININQPTAKIETVFDKTFYGSGVQFTAKVNGKNNPIQTVIWTIEETVDEGTSIVNGVLTVAIADHGKTLTVKATSTVDVGIFKTITITAVKCLPSDFYGTWISENIVKADISANKVIFTIIKDETYGTLEITNVEASFNTDYRYMDQYPCGYKYNFNIVNDTTGEMDYIEKLEFCLNDNGTAFCFTGGVLIYNKN